MVRAARSPAGAGHGPAAGEHVDFALDNFGRLRGEVTRAMEKHQLKLADRQCRMAELSQRMQDNVVILVTALWGHRQKQRGRRSRRRTCCARTCAAS